MKSMYKILSITCLAALAVSCVSAHKYEESINANRNLLNTLQSKQATIDSLKENSSASLRAKEEEIAERERKLEAMEGLVEAQRQAVASLHQEVCSALKCFTPDELTVEVNQGKLYVSLSDKLLFPSGSDQVNPRGKEALKTIASVLGNSELEIVVEGHTDDIPISTFKYQDNWDLSAHRATSVARILLDNGIKPDRIAASGRGEYQPIAPNDNPEGRQANRRTEIVLAPRLDKLWELTEMQDSYSSK